jgi:hypothetical protein
MAVFTSLGENMDYEFRIYARTNKGRTKRPRPLPYRAGHCLGSHDSPRHGHFLLFCRGVAGDGARTGQGHRLHGLLHNDGRRRPRRVAADIGSRDGLVRAVQPGAHLRVRGDGGGPDQVGLRPSVGQGDGDGQAGRRSDGAAGPLCQHPLDIAVVAAVDPAQPHR